MERFDELERQELFEAAFEHAPVAMALGAPDGRLVEINAAFCALLGRPREELLGMSGPELFHPDDAAALLADMERIRSGQEVELERRVRRANGELVWVLLSASTIRDAQGEPRWLLGHCLDITDRKRAEAELAGANAELARSNAELEQFAYVASHDLQEPLRMVASFTELLAQRYGDRLDDDAREFIGYAVDGATRMQHLLQDLLQYSRIQRREPVRQTIDCQQLVTTVLHDLSPATDEAGITVDVGTLPTITADPTLLRLVFQNLLANAIKFRAAEHTPRVWLTATREDGAWRFDVADNGIGVPPTQRQRIFGMFQRLHARDDYPGTGIGLSMVTKGVERHGGHVWASDTEGGGTTFSFTIPDPGEDGPIKATASSP
jgi:PAS domain S-box-containing protein